MDIYEVGSSDYSEQRKQIVFKIRFTGAGSTNEQRKIQLNSVSDPRSNTSTTLFSSFAKFLSNTKRNKQAA